MEQPRNANRQLYILGDVGFGNVDNILRRLNGNKYLIQGNHDKFLEKESFDKSLFVWIKDIERIQYKKQNCILCHYPMAVWDKSHKGAIHLYGHVHINGLSAHPWLKTIPNAYNAGVSVNNFIPCTITEIISNNEYWKNHPNIDTKQNV